MELIHFDAARRELALAHDIDEVKDIRDKAEALRQYARQVGLGLEMQNQCCEIKLRAERRAGELLGERPMLHGARPPDTGSHGVTPQPLKEVGISKMQSSRWQAIASVPEKQFEEHIERIKKAQKELTSARVHRLAAEIKRKEQREQTIIQSVHDAAIITGDFRELGGSIERASVDLIFTDPPYGVESIGLYGDLSFFARRVLRPGGLCLAYAGQSSIPQVLDMLEGYLDYMWTFAVRHTGGELRFRKFHLRNAWKPIFAFYKPPLSVWWEWFSDVVSGGKEKYGHDWQQAEAEAGYFIERFSPADGLVVDPLCGSGTTLAAAKRLNRNYLGFEINEETATYARARLEKI